MNIPIIHSDIREISFDWKSPETKKTDSFFLLLFFLRVYFFPFTCQQVKFTIKHGLFCHAGLKYCKKCISPLYSLAFYDYKKTHKVSQTLQTLFLLEPNKEQAWDKWIRNRRGQQRNGERLKFMRGNARQKESKKVCWQRWRSALCEVKLTTCQEPQLCYYPSLWDTNTRSANSSSCNNDSKSKSVFYSRPWISSKVKLWEGNVVLCWLLCKRWHLCKIIPNHVI